MNTKRPEALRIAEWLEGIRGNTWPSYIPQEAAAELRRQHAEIETLRAGYSAARLEIESLKERVQQLGQLARDVNSRRVTALEAQLAAVGAGGVEPLRKRCLHQISEPARPVFGLPGTRDIDVAAAQRVWDAARGAAQAAPHVGESRFESWYAQECDKGWGTKKQLARAAYAAGMGDYAAQAAPVDAAVQRDAERWQFFADYMVSTDLDDEIVGCDSVQKMARVLDAARATQKEAND